MDLFDIVAARVGGGSGGGVPQVQSDWEQSDSSKKDYIKNRPFYEDNVTMPYTKTSFSVAYDPDVPSSSNYDRLYLIAGETYVITGEIPGVTTMTTEAVAYAAPSNDTGLEEDIVLLEVEGYIFIADKMAFDTSTSDVIIDKNSCVVQPEIEELYNFNVYIEGKFGDHVLKKIDEKFLPYESSIEYHWTQKDNLIYFDVQPTIAEEKLNEQFVDFFTGHKHYYVYNKGLNAGEFKLALNAKSFGANCIDQIFTLPEGHTIDNGQLVFLKITSPTNWKMGYITDVGVMGTLTKPKGYDVLEFYTIAMCGDFGRGYDSQYQNIIDFALPYKDLPSPIQEFYYGKEGVIETSVISYNIFADVFEAVSNGNDAYTFLGECSGKIVFTDNAIVMEGDVMSIPLALSEDTNTNNYLTHYPAKLIWTWADKEENKSFKEYCEEYSLVVIWSSLCKGELHLVWRKSNA